MPARRSLDAASRKPKKTDIRATLQPLCDARPSPEAGHVMELFRARTSKQVCVAAAALALGLTALSGCDSTGYSPDLRYPPRTDPFYPNESALPGDELVFPDRPGQLPVLSMAQALQPDNPLFVAANGKKLLDPRDLKPELRASLDADLAKMFGTPARPTVTNITAENNAPEVVRQLQETLKLDDDTLAKGSQYYRIQCLHCHGLPGDGRGPTSFWVNPHPRDYRQGVFKFISSKPGGQVKPRREDLLRTVRHGIDGSSMPAFGLLPSDEVEAIVSYVIHLSLRGEIEVSYIKDILSAGETEYSPEFRLVAFGRFWLDAQKSDSLMVPPDYPYDKIDPPTNAKDKEAIAAAVRRGQEFFNDTGKGGCVSCHTDYGRKAKFRYDQWGTLVRPADLTAGVYRGGRRPIDLYWRVEGGIPGSGMAAFGETLAQEAEKYKKTGGKEGKVQSPWDVVKFLEILPYPQMRAEYGIQID
jgi:mono/diheme cytochrome c family protein